MDPTRKTKRSSVDLCKVVRLQASLQKAWAHVEKRVNASKDKDTKKALARFRANPFGELRSIRLSLSKGTFKFEKQRGYPKTRKGKRPRPIVIAPIVNRIVQRAILDVCQTDDAKLRRALGSLASVIDCPTSVGGLPGRGVPEAIEKIRNAIDGGAKWYARSDLKNFFTAIPKTKIETFLRSNVKDGAFVDLFMQALATELANEADILADLDLFPTGDDGVPQGSALSALCANIILAEFDQKLNGRGVTTIRYVDDFVILAPTKRAIQKAWQEAEKLLNDVGLSAHDPALMSGKASTGEIASGFTFLSFRVDDRDTVASKEAQERLLDSIRMVIREAKRTIRKTGPEPRRAEPAFVQSLVLIDKKIRGWGDAFRTISQRIQFAQMDDKIDVIVDEFIIWFSRQSKSATSRVRRRKMGIALLSDTEPIAKIS